MSANQQILAAVSGGAVVGQFLYNGFSDDDAWVVPAGVTSISVVCVGPGLSTNAPNSGGCLRYVNNIVVTPGETLRIDGRENGCRLRRGATVLCYGPAWYKRASAVGTGGNGGTSGAPGQFNGGGGGAGGYSGNGGNGGAEGSPGQNGSGGGGGGGGGASQSAYRGAGGGGVGVLGIGANGAAGGAFLGGGGGSGGSSGAAADSVTNQYPSGGSYGGGGGSYNGAVRIIWPGNLRQFPSTRTANE